MNGAIRVLLKDLRLGPRSPVILWALVLPIVATLLIRGVFGSLFAAEPRVGIVDRGSSRIAEQLRETDGIAVRDLDDPDQLRRLVRDHDLDAGLVLQAGIDDAIRAGERPLLELFISGESLASDRAVIAVTTLDIVREVEGATPPVDVQVTALGEAGLDLTARLVPLLVVMAVAIAGAFVPAASLVEEKERGTLSALLVTPVSMTDVLVAKGALGVILATVTGLVTLALNDAFGGSATVLVAAIVLGAITMAEFGLLLGTWARDTNTMFTAWKGGAILLFVPVLPVIWPNLPGWIAWLGPTYWFIHPVQAVALDGATASDVWWELAVALAIVVVLAPLVTALGRWLEQRLAAGTSRRPTRERQPEPV